MGYLIDTNILSELQKGSRCDASVQRWYAATDGDELFLSVLVIGEIRLGIERLRRRDAVQSVRLEQNYWRWNHSWPGAFYLSPKPSQSVGDA